MYDYRSGFLVGDVRSGRRVPGRGAVVSPRSGPAAAVVAAAASAPAYHALNDGCIRAVPVGRPVAGSIPRERLPLGMVAPAPADVAPRPLPIVEMTRSIETAAQLLRAQ